MVVANMYSIGLVSVHLNLEMSKHRGSYKPIQIGTFCKKLPFFGNILIIQFSGFCRHSFILKKRIFLCHTHIISLSVGPIIGLIAMPYILVGSFPIFILVNFFFRLSICVFSRCSDFAIGPNILIIL